jgi:hypothetical protein
MYASDFDVVDRINLCGDFYAIRQIYFFVHGKKAASSSHQLCFGADWETPARPITPHGGGPID